ncbi:MAG TPA: hypothetical protein VGO11_11880 [Chthoniobacteraceae bacterium]|nr:hypothetical protein [Chthoniobacteraceae bacterium]
MGCYYKGRGITLDYAQAMHWFTKAAEQGSPQARSAIGTMYAMGFGVPKNQAEAKKWNNKARTPPQLPKEVAEALAAASSLTLFSLQPWAGPNIPQWDLQGHHVLGHLDLPPDQAKTARAALQSALSAGNAYTSSMCEITPRHALVFKTGEDVYAILICYQCGQLEVFKNDKPLPFDGMIVGKPDVLNGLLKAAGLPLADHPAALQRSYAQEAKAALKLAEQGDAKAQDVIARMFMGGRGVTRDESTGIKWLGKSLSSSPDDPDFQVTLGKMYRRDNDLKKNYAKALKLFQQAAAQGSVEAQYQMAELYEFGYGVAKSPAEAMKWFRKAAENGNVEAQFEIGVRSAQGRDLPLDYTEALRWLQKAADRAHPQALSWMGNMYEEGWGVPQDPVEAYFWHRLAHQYGTPYGKEFSFWPAPEQLAAVDKRVADWIATHPKPRSGE